MAKRRKIQAPSEEHLSAIEEEFRRETLNKPNSAMAPISQVAAETAQSLPVTDAESRMQAARDMSDAALYRRAAGQGRVIELLPIASIQADAIVRDRMVIKSEEMDELKASIRDHGLRLPIEVFAQKSGPRDYALLSGYRRLRAFKELYEETNDEMFQSIPALLRDPETLGGGFAAMVEENEIRASLSHYERGRIAVVAAQHGSFQTTDDAIAQLFRAASKAKRSKIRSFALIFEELGDLLKHAEEMKERDGLKLAGALRSGLVQPLRRALEDSESRTSEVEVAALHAAIDQADKPRIVKKGGRPKKQTREVLANIQLSDGLMLKGERDGPDYIIRLRGASADDACLQRALNSVVQEWSGKLRT